MVSSLSLNKRSTTVLIAVVLALGTGLLLFNYLGSVSRTAQAVPMRDVVVATVNIPPHTLVKPQMVTVTQRSEDAVDPDASGNPAAVVGQMTLIDVPAGSELSSAKLGSLDTGALTMHVPAGERAISIALDPVKGVADLVDAGDRVDVIAVTAPHGSGAPHVATILRDKVVLAMGSSMQPSTTNDAIGAAANAATNGASTAADNAVQTATLAVTPHEAAVLALADLNATLRLSLRSNREPNRPEADDPFVPDAAPAPVVQAAAPAPAAAPAVRVLAPAPRVRRAPGIQMIDGDQVR